MATNEASASDRKARREARRAQVEEKRRQERERQAKLAEQRRNADRLKGKAMLEREEKERLERERRDKLEIQLAKKGYEELKAVRRSRAKMDDEKTLALEKTKRALSPSPSPSPRTRSRPATPRRKPTTRLSPNTLQLPNSQESLRSQRRHSYSDPEQYNAHHYNAHHAAQTPQLQRPPRHHAVQIISPASTGSPASAAPMHPYQMYPQSPHFAAHSPSGGFQQAPRPISPLGGFPQPSPNQHFPHHDLSGVRPITMPRVKQAQYAPAVHMNPHSSLQVPSLQHGVIPQGRSAPHSGPIISPRQPHVSPASTKSDRSHASGGSGGWHNSNFAELENTAKSSLFPHQSSANSKRPTRIDKSKALPAGDVSAIRTKKGSAKANTSRAKSESKESDIDDADLAIFRQMEAEMKKPRRKSMNQLWTESNKNPALPQTHAKYQPGAPTSTRTTGGATNKYGIASSATSSANGRGVSDNDFWGAGLTPTSKRVPVAHSGFTF